MTTLKQLLQRTHDNLQILEERRARQGSTPDLKLLNEIEDHQQAITLIEEALSVELTETQLKELKETLRPLLGAIYVETIDVDELKFETPPLPFEPETVLIPAGPFLMGSQPHEDAPENETPQHEVNLPAYHIGKYPITNEQYAEFVKREGKQEYVPRRAGWFLGEPPPDKLDHPVVGLNWRDAVAYCQWLGQETGRTYRLPTEAEWEKAASWAAEQASSGARGRKRAYPWGDKFDQNKCNTSEAGPGETTPVGKYSPQGDSPYGCADMAGNVQEWTSTLWGSSENRNDFPYPYRVNDGREDPKADEYLPQVYRVYRGGSFNDDSRQARCSARGCSDAATQVVWRGFRVVLEI
jgi:formylglycine-generating enzyme required for sulfatase activity